MRRVVTLIACCACSSSPAAPDAGPNCVFQISGNTTGTTTSAQCATLASSSDAGSGAWILSIAFEKTIDTLVGFHAQIDLGTATPTGGSYSSAVVDDWSARSDNDATCTFTAGSSVVPTGNFTLTLAPFGDAGVPARPHGTLLLQMNVHAPPTIDCGPRDTEDVLVTF